MDRDANDTFDLLDEIEKELGIATCPVNWPIGSGKNFKGVYDRNTKEVMTFSDTLKGTKEGTEKHIAADDPALIEEIGQDAYDKLMEEIELLDGASAEFDMDLVTKGQLSPVFFGSALTNFGVETFLQHFLKMTYSPLPRKADIGEIDPFDEHFSAFVFNDSLIFLLPPCTCVTSIPAVNFPEQIRINAIRSRCALFIFACILNTNAEKCSSNGSKKDKTAAAAADDGTGAPYRRRGVCGGYHRSVRSGDFAPSCAICCMPFMNCLRFMVSTWRTLAKCSGAKVGIPSNWNGFAVVLKYRREKENNVETRMDNLPYEHIRWIENEEIDMDKLVGTSDMKKIQE